MMMVADDDGRWRRRGWRWWWQDTIFCCCCFKEERLGNSSWDRFLFLYIFSDFFYFFVTRGLSTYSIRFFVSSSCFRRLVSLARVGFLLARDAWLWFYPLAGPAPPVWRCRARNGPGRSSAGSRRCSPPPHSNLLANCRRRTVQSLQPSLMAWRDSLWFCPKPRSVSGWLCPLVSLVAAFLCCCSCWGEVSECVSFLECF